MSVVEVEAAHGAHGHGEHGGHEEHLAHQFEDREQQDDAYLVGMWTFLVTEIMFFGALFLAFTIYRNSYPEAFSSAHHELNVTLGTINTFILLGSSLTMALGVRAAQVGEKGRRELLAMLGITILCAFGFLVIKGFEYADKFEHHHFPGPNFAYEQPEKINTRPEEQRVPSVRTYQSSTAPALSNNAQLFFALYFAMTGLHALHIIIGIGILGAIFIMVKFRHPSVAYYMPIELAGLYWHFVDIVWIFLFPLLYLLG